MPITFRCDCGKLFVTADANAGRRMICTQCGRAIGIPGPEIAYIEDTPRLSRKAVNSLVLGVCSFVFCCMTGIPAVLVGFGGLLEINRSRGRIKGSGMAIWGMVLGCLGTLFVFGVLFGCVGTAKEAARRSQCINNLKYIGLAFRNLHSEQGHFPSDIKNAENQPLLSWRVAILPYMEQGELYRKFRLDEPWDSPANLTLIDQMPAVYACPTSQFDPGQTSYQVIVGPGSIFEKDQPPTMDRITDGTDKTLLVVEAARPVPWTKPDDVAIRAILTALGSQHAAGENVLFADGSVRFLKKSVSPTTLRALATRAGGEVIPVDAY